jgi:hypothetical protein
MMRLKKTPRWKNIFGVVGGIAVLAACLTASGSFFNSAQAQDQVDVDADRAMAERLSRAMHAADRTRSVVTRILDETNSVFLILWAYQENGAESEDMVLTPDERRSRNWEAFYKNPEAHINYDDLARNCVEGVYARYFDHDELVLLADFLERTPKTREDARAFAQTPTGRKYRAVMRRLSSESLRFIQAEVDEVVRLILADGETTAKKEQG